ncbi:MAG: carotenoid biosynthesis protein [Ignavibacteriales bacterium]|nr:carotenoid biosynthesis protein [Ignavibacteriales bacterium]
MNVIFAYKELRDSIELKKVKNFLITFYFVGLLGFIIPFTNEIFIFLTPYAILLSFVLILFFHQSISLKKNIFIFIIIYLSGFLIEMIGVNTGNIFGEYYYGAGLGLKIFNTPLLIGINWLMLVYCSANILSRRKINYLVKALIASMIMVAYDLVLEQVAPKLNMWYWKDSYIPIQNYLAWFVIAFMMHLIFKQSDNKNPIAGLVLILQIIFFTLLFLYFNLV